MKKVLISIVSLVALVAIAGVIKFNFSDSDIHFPSKGNEICYYTEVGQDPAMIDIAWLRVNFDGDFVTGEFQNIPAQTDSKIGEFSGNLSSIDPSSMTQKADLWWQAFAEGMLATEQLKIRFGEDAAEVGYGEMTPDDQGRYVYTDPENISYWQPLSNLSDRLDVADYIRNNVRTLAPEDPVLGGQWYAYGILINPESKSGSFAYEDGHIQGMADFSYSVEDDEILISDVTKK